MRILALVPGGIGDQFLVFPTLETLKQQYPQATIDVLVEPRSKSTYRVCQFVNDVLIFDYQDRNGLADYLNLLGTIRDREYEAALNFGQQWVVELLLWLNGIPVRVGYQDTNVWFTTHPIPKKTEQYTAGMYHDLVAGLGIHAACPPLTVSVPKVDIDWAEAEQKRLDIKESGYILLYDGSSQSAENAIYPIPKWQQIVKDIQEKQPNVPLVLLQDEQNREFVSKMSAIAPDLKIIAPSDMGKLAAAIAGANLLLCTDSAPMHLAVAVGTYTIALLGPTAAKKRLPADSDKCFGIQSQSKTVADIAPVTVLEKIWNS